MLRSLRVQNFKCLRDVTVDLEPLTVLVGKNDTGKSSFLDALHSLSALVHGEQGRFVGDRAIDALRSRDAPSNDGIRFFATIAATPENGLPAPAKYFLEIGQGASPEAIEVRSENLLFEGEDTNRLVGAMLSGDAADAFALIDGTSRVILQHRTDAAALSWITGVRDLDALSRVLTAPPPYRFEPKQLAVRSELGISVLAPSGHGLPSVLDNLLGTKRAAFDRIERDLKGMVPFVEAIQTPQWKDATGAGKALAFGLSRGGSIDASQMSDGVLLFLGYLTLVHSPNPPAILLLEEPENGVHPRQLGRIVDYLKLLTDPSRGPTRTQVVIATHSPYLLDFVPPESVRVFGRKADGGDTVVKRLNELPRFAERLAAGQTLGEIWFNVGEDRLLKGALDAPASGE